MASVRKVLVKGFAGLVVFVGVSSLISLGIMAGMKVAYAASDHSVVANEEQNHYVFVLETAREQRGPEMGLIKPQAIRF